MVFFALDANDVLKNLNLCTLLEKYCYSRKLAENELDFLERSWIESLNSLNYNRFPGIAPAIVCDKAEVPRGSYWIFCNAAILDKIRPLGQGKNRSKRIFDLLTESGLMAA